MSNKERTAQAAIDTETKRTAEPRRITIAEARRMAFEASDKAQQARIAFAEEEANRRYDYLVEE